MSVDISPEAAERAAIMLEGMPEVDLIGRDGLGDEITVSALLRALRTALTAKEAELAEMKAALADTIRKDLDALNERCDEIDALKSQLTEAIRALMSSPAPDQSARELALIRYMTDEGHWQALEGHDPESIFAAFNAQTKDHHDD